MRSIAPRESAARRYRIEQYLTEGGMGAIYLGKKLGPGGFEKEVVLKQLLPEYTRSPSSATCSCARRRSRRRSTTPTSSTPSTWSNRDSRLLHRHGVRARAPTCGRMLRRLASDSASCSPAAAIHIALRDPGRPRLRARKRDHGRHLLQHHPSRRLAVEHPLFRAQGEVKLSDFGIAKASTHSSVFYRVRGQGRVHVARAGAQPAHRSPQRSVFAGGVPVRGRSPASGCSWAI